MCDLRIYLLSVIRIVIQEKDYKLSLRYRDFLAFWSFFSHLDIDSILNSHIS